MRIRTFHIGDAGARVHDSLFRFRPPLPLDSMIQIRKPARTSGNIEGDHWKEQGGAGGLLSRRGAKTKAKRGTSYFNSSTHDGLAFVIHFARLIIARHKTRSLRVPELQFIARLGFWTALFSFGSDRCRIYIFVL